MLKQRIATALVLLIGLIAMTTSLGLEAFAAITGALVLIGAWEWAAFASLGDKSRLAFLGTLALSIALHRNHFPLWFSHQHQQKLRALNAEVRYC